MKNHIRVLVESITAYIDKYDMDSLGINESETILNTRKVILESLKLVEGGPLSDKKVRKIEQRLDESFDDVINVFAAANINSPEIQETVDEIDTKSKELLVPKKKEAKSEDKPKGKSKGKGKGKDKSEKTTPTEAEMEEKKKKEITRAIKNIVDNVKKRKGIEPSDDEELRDIAQKAAEVIKGTRDNSRGVPIPTGDLKEDLFAFFGGMAKEADKAHDDNKKLNKAMLKVFNELFEMSTRLTKAEERIQELEEKEEE